MGSGLISDPQRMDAILDQVHSETDIIVSMKMRMGYENCYEILETFPVLEKYPVKSIAIHARIGKQLYKGGVDLEGFQRCIDHSKQKLYYNGDITSFEKFQELEARFPSIDHWMIGRGLIADPYLPQMVKNRTSTYPEDRIEVFSKFHDRLFSEYEKTLTGEKHVIMKMLSYWQYFATTFSNPTKIVKKIKKAKTIQVYDDAVKWILDNERTLQSRGVEV